jgi:TolB-like protein/tetratricopeptide (TPR) repeat protein
VAIMPFENRTGNPALDYVGPSLADEISSHLAEVSEVKVIASYSAASLWATNLGMRGLLDTLDIGHLFDGSLEMRDGELTINVQHYSAEGVIVDSRSFAADARLLDSLQSAVARTIAETFLEGMGLPRTFEEADTHGPGRDAYLNGMAWLGQRTPEGFRRAIERFSEAIALDPRYAAAYAGLSNAYALALVYMYDVGVLPYEAAARAVYFAERAVELDPRDAAGHTARGHIRGLVRQVDAAEEAFGRALAIAPNAPDGPSWSARILEARGQNEEALREALRARDLDPFHSARHIAVAGLAMVRGDHALAVDEAREALRLEPTLLLARAFEARSLALGGRADECLRLDLGVYRLIRALCLVVAGRGSEADHLVADAEAGLADGEGSDPEYWPVLATQDLAAFHAFVGDPAAAARWLRAAFEQSPFGVDSRLIDSALFDPVRADASFAATLEEVRAEAWLRVQQELERVEGTLAGR